MSCQNTTPRFKIGDRVRVDRGWDREVIVIFVITEISANHGALGAHRYWGTDAHGVAYGAYEDQIRGIAPSSRRRAR